MDGSTNSPNAADDSRGIGAEQERQERALVPLPDFDPRTQTLGEYRDALVAAIFLLRPDMVIVDDDDAEVPELRPHRRPPHRRSRQA